MKAALSRDTDTGEEAEWWCWLSWSKINVLAIPKTHVFKCRRGRMSKEKGGLIGEECWELRAGQQGRSGRRKNDVRAGMDGCLILGGRPLLSQLTPLPSYRHRWIIKRDGIKQNKLTWYACAET